MRRKRFIQDRAGHARNLFPCVAGFEGPETVAQDRLVELAAWCAPRYRFEDFLFAYGARRRGGRLVVDK